MPRKSSEPAAKPTARKRAAQGAPAKAASKRPPAKKAPMKKLPRRPVPTSVREAVSGELAGMDLEERQLVLAAAAVRLAEAFELAASVEPKSVAALSRELRETMQQLRQEGSGEPDDDWTTRLGAAEDRNTPQPGSPDVRTSGGRGRRKVADAADAPPAARVRRGIGVRP